MRTGFQRVAQVLSDTLLREMQQASRKLVVFSDSRQDAAKLSAGMRFAHYRDAVRQALATTLETAGRGAAAFADQLAGHSLDPDRQVLADMYRATHPTEAGILMAATNAFLADQSAGTSFPNLTNRQASQQILQQGAHGPFPITQLAEDISARLLIEGINPGGFTQDVLWKNSHKREGSWRQLYEWHPSGQPTPRVNSSLAPDEQDHLQRIRDAAFREVTDAIFASGRRSLEALGIGLATTDRLRFPASSPLIQEAADSVIQLIGSRRYKLSTHGAMPQLNLPVFVTGYLDQVAAHNQKSPPDFRREVYDLLHRAQVCSPAQNRLACRRHSLHSSGTGLVPSLASLAAAS